MTDFIIYSSPRCGSNWICDLLNSHTNVTCLGEIFHNSKLITGADNSFDTIITEGFEVKKKNEKPWKYYQHLRNKCNTEHFGFKIFPRHANQTWKFFLKRPKFKHIFLYRENKLAQFSSLLIAKKSKIWLRINDEKKISNQKVYFNKNEFEIFCKKEDEYFKNFILAANAGQVPHICLSYETLKTSNMKLYLFNFIGVSSDKNTNTIKSNLNIMNETNVFKRFENPNVVHSYLKSINKEEWGYLN